jgi:hypothetical protein
MCVVILKPTFPNYAYLKTTFHNDLNINFVSLGSLEQYKGVRKQFSKWALLNCRCFSPTRAMSDTEMEMPHRHISFI